jgi:hypothetical protein
MKNICIALSIIVTILAQTVSCASRVKPVARKPVGAVEQVTTTNPCHLPESDEDLLINALYGIARRQGAIELANILRPGVCTAFTALHLYYALQHACLRTDQEGIAVVRLLLAHRNFRGERVKVMGEGEIADALRAAGVIVVEAIA